MIGKKAYLFLFIIFFVFISYHQVLSQTRLKDSSVHEISVAVSTNRFDDAVTRSQRIIDSEPANPVGYFLLGALEQTLSEEFRSDGYNKEIDSLLTLAIERSDEMKDLEPDNSELYFISGASYGYRAIHRAFHGHWFKAFRDGLKCSSHLGRSLELDSTYYDAYWGMGSYLYYRTIKARDFLWLPFISDQREEGMTMIKEAIANGQLAGQLARESFLRIYWTEERYDDLVNLADSLYAGLPEDAYILIYYVEGLLGLDRLDEAEMKINELKTAWKNSPYYDISGALEGDFLAARLAHKRGETETANKLLEQILSRKDLCDSNAYFRETYDKAKAFHKKIR
ncbi:MAG: hypothetical protein CVT49_06900 [candidate division Zixibacteria bacterium HGW-Zixibacteria-1]|nr:MAG: hypothetical protein CVT49_06900 [candidate division Zixibacteria bacterium HGW-Zixibacteria-1]